MLNDHETSSQDSCIKKVGFVLSVHPSLQI